MKLQLSPLVSDIFICIYILVSLFFRFYFESKTDVGPINSIVIGASFVVIIWSLIKLKILNPNWFGLFKPKKNK
ncbi:hypothetical protein C7447_10827 [Tenacibaculum adriaticum]|uniref:Uncharacterized protein n=1 Tax=Tenacibaculum adriaticum TaxID=413713 RepID=A0A5S5DK40_9FLAO|nr:hypothetical protein C7447_10827 [Tenacibaculum adriaticum]